MEKKLETKLRFTFDIDEEIPVIEITPTEKKEKIKTEIIINKPKRNGRDKIADGSTGLF
jgi:hypothetical protein